jgi:DNA-binding NtrC family response regulator
MYLYKKTHKITGMQYLGVTTQNPFRYTGSGLEWKQHIKQYGNYVTTEILFESENRIEIREKGLYYTCLWNIIESSEFANNWREDGHGCYIHSAEAKSKIAESKYKPIVNTTTGETFKSVTAAAERLGISRTAFYRRLKKPNSEYSYK